MIFYHAIDADGRLHLAATQAEARIISKNFEQTDVPTDKPSLQKFVQDLYDQIFFAKREAPCETDTPEPATDAESIAPQEPVTSSDTVEAGASSMPTVQSEPEESAFNPKLLQEQVEAFGVAGEDAFERFDTYQQDYGVGAGFSRGVHMLTAIASGEHQLCRTLFRLRQRKKW